MKIIKCFMAGLMICLCAIRTMAQVDPHFSQYYAYPLWLNPALTGVIDGDYRATLNLKQQWGSISNSYLTGAASFDMAPVKQFAFGATILDQSAGEASYNYLNALVSASYRIRFGDQGLNIISFGLQAGILNKSFDASKAQYGNQYDPVTGYDPSRPSYESFTNTSSIVPDINAGIFYFDGNADKKANVFAGASISHLSRPVESFMDVNRTIPLRYNAHGGVRIRVSNDLDITPNALFLAQGNAHEIAAGAYAQYMLNAESDLLFGSNYRVDDAAIAFFGLHIRNMTFGLSYDVNTSSLQRASQNRGGLELSISFTSRKGIVGPDFFCPRL